MRSKVEEVGRGEGGWRKEYDVHTGRDAHALRERETERAQTRQREQASDRESARVCAWKQT